MNRVSSLCAWLSSLLLAGALVASPAWGQAIVRGVREAQVDWSAGLISAEAGAAVDIRMPTAESARPGSERRARGAALARLKAALAEVPMGKGRRLTGKAVETAAGKAKTLRIEYQSNGGVLLRLGITFADLVGLDAHQDHDDDHEDDAAGRRQDASDHEEKAPAPPLDLALVIAQAPLEVAPILVVGDREQRLGYAVYRVGPPPASVKVLELRRDKAGRLTLPRGALPGKPKLAQARAVIYLDKPLR